MYGIFPYIYHKNQPNVGKYTIHWASGYRNPLFHCQFLSRMFESFLTTSWFSESSRHDVGTSNLQAMPQQFCPNYVPCLREFRSAPFLWTPNFPLRNCRIYHITDIWQVHGGTNLGYSEPRVPNGRPFVWGELIGYSKIISVFSWMVNRILKVIPLVLPNVPLRFPNLP